MLEPQPAARSITCRAVGLAGRAARLGPAPPKGTGEEGRHCRAAGVQHSQRPHTSAPVQGNLRLTTMECGPCGRGSRLRRVGAAVVIASVASVLAAALLLHPSGPVTAVPVPPRGTSSMKAEVVSQIIEVDAKEAEEAHMESESSALKTSTMASTPPADEGKERGLAVAPPAAGAVADGNGDFLLVEDTESHRTAAAGLATSRKPLQAPGESPFAVERAAGMDARAWPLLDHLWEAATKGRIADLQRGRGQFGEMDDNLPGSASYVLGEKYGYGKTSFADAAKGARARTADTASVSEAELARAYSADPVASEMWSNLKGALADSTCASARHADVIRHKLLGDEDDGTQPARSRPAALELLDDIDLLKLRLRGEHPSVLVIGAGRGHLAMRIAEELHGSTVVSLVWPREVAEAASAAQPDPPACDAVGDLERHLALRGMAGVDNNVVCQSALTPRLVAELKASEARFALIVLADLPALVADMLPHEFETMVGDVLSLARYTAVPHSLPDATFFSFWESSRSLVERASDAAGLTVNLRTLGSKPAAPGWNWETNSENKAAVDTRLLLVESRSIGVSHALARAVKLARGEKKKIEAQRGEWEARRQNAADNFDEEAQQKRGRWSDDYFEQHEVYPSEHDREFDAARAAACNASAADQRVDGTSLATLFRLGLVPQERQRLFHIFLRSSLPITGTADDITFDHSRLVTCAELEAQAAAEAAAARNAAATVVEDTVSAPQSDDIVEEPPLSNSQPTVFAAPDQAQPGMADDDSNSGSRPATKPDDSPQDMPPSDIVADGGKDAKHDPATLPPRVPAAPAAGKKPKRKKSRAAAAPPVAAAAAAPAAAPPTPPAATEKTSTATTFDWNILGGNTAQSVPQDRIQAGGDAAADTPHLRGTNGRRLLGLLSVDEPAHRAAALSTVAAADAVAAADIARSQRSKNVRGRQSQWASSKGKDQARLVGEEGDAFASWWPTLQREMAGFAAADRTDSASVAAADWSVAVYGRGMTLLSTKIARAFPASTVVSVKPEAHEVSPHLELLELLGVRNNLVCRARLTPARVASLRSADDAFRYQILGADVFEHLLAHADAPEEFERNLGNIFSLASTTFVELPTWRALKHALSVMARDQLDGDADATGGAWRTDQFADGADDDYDEDPDISLADFVAPRSPLPFTSRSQSSHTWRPLVGSPGFATAAAISDRYDPTGVAVYPGMSDVSDDIPFTALLRSATSSAGLEGASARFLRPSSQPSAEDADMPGDDGYFGDTDPYDDGLVTGGCGRYVRVDVARWARFKPESQGRSAVVGPHSGVSVHTLLSLGLVDRLRAELFRMFLALPMPPTGPGVTVTPWDVRYQHTPVHRTAAAARAARDGATIEGKKSLVLGGRLQYMARVDGGTRLFSSDDRRAEFARVSGATDEKDAGDGAAPGPAADVVDPRWGVLSAEFSKEDTACGGGPGRFSVVEYNSGAGALSLNLARKFPEATIVSVEQSPRLTDAHLAAVMRGEHNNNIICRREVDKTLASDLRESPEFFRYQILTGDLLDLMIGQGRGDAEAMIGNLLGVAMTTFVQMPSSRVLSLAFTTFFHTYPDTALVRPADAAPELYAVPSLESLAPRFDVAEHPRPAFAGSETRLLSGMARAPGTTEVSVTVLGATARGTVHHHWDSQLTTGADVGAMASSPDVDNAAHAAEWRGISLVRLDVQELTRNVNHHFQSYIDGHDRKYQMQVDINTTATADYHQQLRIGTGAGPFGTNAPVFDSLDLPVGNHPNDGKIMSVGLVRKHDGAPIPYDTINSVTLITVLRLGLLSPQKRAAYHNFVAMPLYEDMAPWNIVFRGSTLDYIDYDTKDHTYDAVIPLIYQAMEVLFNYKRTVEDFKRCGGKAGNPYGFPFVSDCVASEFRGPCSDPVLPVPCPDETCRSDYISCLRALSEVELLEAAEQDRKEAARNALRKAVENDAALAAETGKEWTPQMAADAAAAAGADPRAGNLKSSSFLEAGTWKFGDAGRLVDSDEDDPETGLV